MRNTVHDSTCVAPQVLQFRAVMWGTNDQIRELPPLGDDTVSAATAVNDRGQAVGISGICDIAVGQRSAIHAVRWDGATITDLAISVAMHGTRRPQSTSAATSSVSPIPRPVPPSTRTRSCGRSAAACRTSEHCPVT
ncbi:hypothetical protein [Pyxidicoccus trucidator]|uniref:hypothetical protein n=1 Tax=Pyxidicoccus trucidator TaxID=2709662 RepID=UPI001F071A5C|nr:hypothetical protein [Pyxidicoccus trucidator]